MDDVVIIGLAAIGTVVLVYFVARRTRRLYEQALEVLEAGRIKKIGPFPQGVEGRFQGRSVGIRKSEGGQNSPSRMFFRIEGHPHLELSLAPEGGFERLAKRMGLGGLEVEVGDEEVDEAFLIRTDDREAARRILRDARGAALRLLEEGFVELKWDAEGLQAVKQNYSADDFEPTALRERLRVLDNLLGIAEGRGGGPSAEDVRPWDAMQPRDRDGPPPRTQPTETPTSAGEEDLDYAPTGYEPLQPDAGGSVAGRIFMALVVAGLIAAAVYWFLTAG